MADMTCHGRSFIEVEPDTVISNAESTIKLIEAEREQKRNALLDGEVNSALNRFILHMSRDEIQQAWKKQHHSNYNWVSWHRADEVDTCNRLSAIAHLAKKSKTKVMVTAEDWACLIGRARG